MEKRYSKQTAESYKVWKTIKNTKDNSEYVMYQPSFDRGDECSLIFVSKRSDGNYCVLKSYPKFWSHTFSDLINTETTVLKTMQGVRGVPKLFGEGVFMIDDRKYLPIELCNKGSLFNVIRETGPLSEAELQDVVQTLLEILQSMHSKGIIYRNLNPKHILVHVIAEGIIEYKLCDYKYCFDQNSAKSKPTDFIGSTAYMAPEIHENEDNEYSTPVDIWSLGVTCYHLITGRTPQSVDPEFPFSLSKPNGKLLFPVSVAHQMSPSTIEFITSCLTLDPTKRPTAEFLRTHPFFTSDSINRGQVIGTILEEEAEQFAKLFEKYWGAKLKVPLQYKSSFEPYEEIKRMGTGQFGQIWHVKDRRTGVQYVAKILKRTRLMHEKAISAMVEEILLMQLLQRSPYVINLKEVFIYKGDFYLILEFCNGGDLEVYIQNFVNELPLPLKEFKQIAWNIANGLKSLHLKGRIHGELKPKNVLLVKDDTNRLVDAKLCDLGLAQEVEILAGSTTNTGTTDFYSPEQWENIVNRRKSTGKPMNKITPKTDVFSFGALLYFSVTGNSPFAKGRKHGIVIDYGTKKVHPEIQDLIRACLTPNENERPNLDTILQHKLFEMIIDIPIRSSVMPYVYTDYITKEGKMGVTVMECKRIGNDKELAVKIVDCKGRTSKEYLKRFNEVVDILFKVSMIPTVIKIYDAFFTKETLNIIMSFCNSGDLESYILSQAKQNKQIPLDEKNFIAYCVIHGVHSIHAKHLTHKDLSPRNVLLERDLPSPKLLRARISDFGINRILVEGPVDMAVRNMTNCYIAPEFSEGKADYKADIWSIGMLMFFLYCGKHAHDVFPLKDLGEGKITAEMITEKLKGLPANYVSLIMKCIKVNPMERPNTSEILAHSIFHSYEGTFY